MQPWLAMFVGLSSSTRAIVACHTGKHRPAPRG